jgi:hypothetical protein
MREHRYTRKGNVIMDEKGTPLHVCKSINEAKRKSREMQKQTDGFLGRGSMKETKS